MVMDKIEKREKEKYIKHRTRVIKSMRTNLDIKSNEIKYPGMKLKKREQNFKSIKTKINSN
jgi:hypothetical protein